MAERMEARVSTGIGAHFRELPDPRRETMNGRHKFLDILVIAICGAICGANDWVAVAAFGRAKENWLRAFLELPNGIPSHDTFGDVFSKIDPDRFRKCFISWVESLADILPGDVVAIDGKTSRHSYDRGDSRSPIHMASAWASRSSLVLGQVKTEDKSNEISAIPQLLEILELTGCLVTIDAMGCQKEIARKIREKGADYLLALKENHPKLHESVVARFDAARDGGFESREMDFAETEDRNHGRIEYRRCRVESDISWLERKDEWKDLASVAMIESERHLDGRFSIERRYYLSSAKLEASEFLERARRHWSIENSLHWVLDIAFREDDSRIRKGNGAENFAILRHIAINLLRRDKTAKMGVKNKRLRAGWDETYLLKILSGIFR